MTLRVANSKKASLNDNAMAIVGALAALCQFALMLMILPVIANASGNSLNVVTFGRGKPVDSVLFVCLMLCAMSGLICGAGWHKILGLIGRGRRREALARCLAASLSLLVASLFIAYTATHNLPVPRNSGAWLNVELRFGALVLTLLVPALILLLTSLLLSRQDARTAPAIESEQRRQ